MSKTFLPSVKEVENSRKWHHFDATDKSLGRLASEAAKLLIGKHKAFFTPHMDCGDYVVITNASKVKLTGKKMEQKYYFRHSGYASGAKEVPVKRQLGKDARKVIELAVKRMLNDNKLRAKRMKRLKVFVGEDTKFTGRFNAKKAEAK